MNMKEETRKQALARKLYRLQMVFDLNQIITGEENSPQQIKEYYHSNRFAYQKYHSKEGFIHFRVSKDGKYHEEDIYYQPDVVESRIPRNGQVMEMGFGQGANLFYLAKKRPDAYFYGVDIAPTNPPHSLKNLELFQRDYNDLSMFPSNSFDVVYGIETFTYASQKEHVFREAFRILKSGGVFIVYDFALLKTFEQLDQLGQTTISLIFKSGAAAVKESKAQLEQHFQNAGFQKRCETDLGRNILPDLERIELKASRILNTPRLSKQVLSLLPGVVVNNMIVGYLMPDAGNAGLFTYMEWIYEKN